MKAETLLSKGKLIYGVYVLLILVVLGFFTGFWNKMLKSPIINQQEKFTYLSAQPVDAESVEFFVIMNDYDNFDDDNEEMAKYAMKMLYEHFQSHPELKEMNLMVYYILHAEGSAHMRRKRAIAVLRYDGAGDHTVSIHKLAQ